MSLVQEPLRIPTEPRFSSPITPAQIIMHPANEGKKRNSSNSNEAAVRPSKRIRRDPPSQQQSRRIAGEVFKVPMASSDDNIKAEQQKLQMNKSEHFTLLAQPKPLQRKSYRNERRYLLPNPLTVQYTGDPGAVIVGTVEVFLVNEAGVLFPKEMQDMLEGLKFKSFDDQNHAAFSLLMRTISGDMSLRLKFVVRYRYKVPPRSSSSDKAQESANQEGVEYQEEFMSNSFRVESNRKKPLVDHPCLVSIKPSEGPRNVNQEVLLHGTNFGDGKNIRVRFGGFPVAVVGVDKDTITTVAPLRPDLQPNSRVPVQVGQSHPTRGVIWRPEALFYTYLGDKEVDQPAKTVMVKQPQCFSALLPSLSPDGVLPSFVPASTPSTSFGPSSHIAETPCLSRTSSLSRIGLSSPCPFSLYELAATAVGMMEGDKEEDQKILDSA